MQSIFDEIIVNSFREVVEKSIAEFFSGKGLSAFQQEYRDGMNEIGTFIQQRLIEFIDQELVEDPSLREDWVIERRNDEKTILSPFGPVVFKRTYFRNKTTGKYAYLADRLVGYTPHQRLDTLLEADLLEEVVNKSFRKSGESLEKQARGTSVSGQTVLNVVRKFEPEQIEIKEKFKVKKKCQIIYIEADEDHVAHQGKGTRAFEQRLVYVHEGRRRVGKDRYELIGKKYFTFELGTKTEYIWNTIWQYLDDTYELAETEHIFILGDGASWIKAGAEYIPCSTYVLDGFHLRMAILRAAGDNEDNRQALAHVIWAGKRTKMNRLLQNFHADAKEESRKETIRSVYKYLNNHWGAIQARWHYQHLLVGCSAEGHVSHILSARLSSRPMAWSYYGANQMAHLRVHRANNVDLHKIYLEQSCRHKKQIVNGVLPKASVTILAKAAGASFETFGNIPSLRTGRRSYQPLLRQISNASLHL